MKINMFNEPKIIGIVGNINSGKSNLLYHLIETLQKDFDFDLYSYGLRIDLNEKKIYSIEELERIKNSVIILDEFFTLFDLEDRRKRKMIESTLRLINHNNNILILCGSPENFKKFISNKLDIIIFKKCSLGDFINGSWIKRVCLSYKGYELGSSILNVDDDLGLVFDGGYSLMKIPYLKKYDTKIKNESILKKRSPKRGKRVTKNVEK